ncbi:MAG: hypothetical protein ACRD2W_14745 [Acidimicrobiales bacterium]
MTEVAVLFGGPSAEHDVSILTGLQVVRALSPSRGTRAIYWSKSGDWFEVEADLEAMDFLTGPPRSARALTLRLGADGGFYHRRRRLGIDVAVNCCHGGPGEDGTLSGVLQLANIPFTGPRVSGAALGMDKYAFGKVIEAVGLPVLPRSIVGDDLADPPFPPPYLIKPRFGGSSIGIEIVEDIQTARALSVNSPHLRRGAIVEPFVAGGRDLNIAVRTYPSFQFSEIEEPHRAGTEGHAILDYRDKYLAAGGLAGASRDLPANISAEIRSQIEDAARTITRSAEVRGLARIDFLLAGDHLYVNEINTIPGLLASYLWTNPPLTFATLLAELVEEAQNDRWSYSSSGSDGTVLRSAKSIAAKLGL